ncbi:calcium and integrin-binding protein 1-like [Corticium candelabrum]|uniref:calcium and integrin-binding protein 1-like n=1 Tax=Corticium candelabrum TaxID=121492 RepID=UPI002E2770C9|nr:calcium and integrin-binding protein 1-like [Corticium candelabrum]
MGGVCTHQTVFSDEELEEYSNLTYFSKAEVLYAFKRFSMLDPVRVAQNRNAKLTMRTILNNLNELSVNPFKERICKVFSSSGNGDLTFEDFLDMMSVFSEEAPKSLKIQWAFRVYDFDDDRRLNRKDLQILLSQLCGQDAELLDDDKRLSTRDQREIVDQILQEGDLDQDDSLSFPEFEILISKCPEFLNTFRIKL